MNGGSDSMCRLGQFPTAGDTTSDLTVWRWISLDGQQLNWLLDGYDLAAMRPHRSLCYRTVL